MNLIFMMTFILVVMTTSYLLHQYQFSKQLKTRKSSLPLPPISSSNFNINLQTIDIKDKILNSSTEVPKTPDNWQKLITEMRKEGQNEPALKLCISKFPLYSAYRRATVILRSVLHTKGLSERKTHKTLLRLYRTAAAAEMIHMKRSREDAISFTELKKMNMSSIENIPFDYNILGYKELPLLTQKDIKIIVNQWGEPKKHDSPRKAYQKYLN